MHTYMHTPLCGVTEHSEIWGIPYHPITQIFGPFIERHGYVLVFKIYNHKIQIKNLDILQTRHIPGFLGLIHPLHLMDF